MKHILIVGDASAVRMYHRSILTAAGYAVGSNVGLVTSVPADVLFHYVRRFLGRCSV